MPDMDSEVICKNVFKDGENVTSKDKFTRAWIDMINQMEKSSKLHACFYLCKEG